MRSSRQIERLAFRAKLIKCLALARARPLAINALSDTVKRDDAHLLLLSHVDGASIWLELRKIVSARDLLIFTKNDIGKIPKDRLFGLSAKPGKAKAGDP